MFNPGTFIIISLSVFLLQTVFVYISIRSYFALVVYVSHVMSNANNTFFFKSKKHVISVIKIVDFKNGSRVEMYL